MIKNYISSTALGINSTSFPINTITGLQNYPFKEKAVPRIGLSKLIRTAQKPEVCIYIYHKREQLDKITGSK